MAIVGLKVEDGVVFSLNEQNGDWERAGIDLIPGLEELLKRLESLSYSLSSEEGIIFTNANECARPQELPLSKDIIKMPIREPINHNVEHSRASLENVRNHTTAHTHAKRTGFKKLNGHKTTLVSMLRCLDRHYYSRLNRDYLETSGVSYIKKDAASAKWRLNGSLIRGILRYNRLYSTGAPESRFYLEITGTSKNPH